nr:protein kinase [Nannocystis sp. RBIL2]
MFGDTAPASAIGRFQIQRMLGSGGMGVVYAATDPQLGRTVALKLIQPTTAGEHATERLLREAQAMARLQHPNVVAVHEAGVYGGRAGAGHPGEGAGPRTPLTGRLPQQPRRPRARAAPTVRCAAAARARGHHLRRGRGHAAA